LRCVLCGLVAKRLQSQTVKAGDTYGVKRSVFGQRFSKNGEVCYMTARMCFVSRPQGSDKIQGPFLPQEQFMSAGQIRTFLELQECSDSMPTTKDQITDPQKPFPWKTQPRFSGRLMNPTALDLGLFKHWISTCCTHHGQKCAPVNLATTGPSDLEFANDD